MSAPAQALPATGLTTAVAASVRDLLEHPVPLVAANIVWGAVALAAWFAWLVSPISGLAATVALAWPTAAVAGVAARVVRGEAVGVRDAWRWPSSSPAVLVLGIAAVAGATVAIVDLAAGLDRGDPSGIALATVACWGLVALVVIGGVVWPLLGDPSRPRLGAHDALRIAVGVGLRHTRRTVAASALVVAGLVVSALMVAPLLSVSVSLAASLLCRVVLPLADVVSPLVVGERR